MKPSSSGPAAPRLATPQMRTPPSPRSSRPSRSAICPAVYAFVSISVPCSSSAPSERAAEGELQALDLVAAADQVPRAAEHVVLLADRIGIADRDRADRRAPHQRD